MRREAWSIFLTLAVLLSSIPVAVAGMDDFKIARIEVVDDYDQADVSPMGRRPRPMFKVTLSSDLDLRDDTRNGFHVGVSVGVCLEGSFTVDDTKNLMGAHVYDAFGNINDHREIRSSGASEYAYHFYFNVAFKTLFDPMPEQPERFSWDLRKKPEDVCFVIRGGKMLTGGFATNLMMIPAADLTDAIVRSDLLKKGASAKTNSIRDRH